MLAVCWSKHIAEVKLAGYYNVEQPILKETKGNAIIARTDGNRGKKKAFLHGDSLHAARLYHGMQQIIVFYLF